jgi:hypothetical protein
MFYYFRFGRRHKEMNRLSRSTALKIAAVITFLVSVWDVIGSLPLIAQGAAALDESTPGPPYFVLMLSFVLSIIGIVAAYGTWKQMRWGIILTIIIRLLGGLSAAPGIVFRPTPELFMSATFSVAVSIVVIVLCLWRDPKPASAQA